MAGYLAGQSVELRIFSKVSQRASWMADCWAGKKACKSDAILAAC